MPTGCSAAVPHTYSLFLGCPTSLSPIRTFPLPGTLLSCAVRVRSHPTPLEKVLSPLAYPDPVVAPGW